LIRSKFNPTPIEKRRILSSEFSLDIDLVIKRDDLFPMPGGGIKSRKILYIMDEILNNKHDVIVTNGGPQSNHARAAALMAAKFGLRCHLVIVLEPGVEYPLTGNILLMKMSGAVIEYCRKDQLSESMDCAMEHYSKAGYKPVYIWGGGHNAAGTHAFVEAAEEAQNQCGKWIPDYLVMASGTGSTQAGLIIGYEKFRTKVIGISVARNQKRGTSIISECIKDYYCRFELPAREHEIYFYDKWAFGGYEKTSNELLNVINRTAKTGIILDPTYSGKGFFGLVEMVKSGQIPGGSKVLFWHTGGLLNVMGSSLSEGSITL